MAPLAIDLYCGLGGWTDGLLTEGFRVVGFDIERHIYGEHAYPAQLVLQDVLTIHGAQFKDAALIVASPPCQGYSYRAMPWKRAKALPPPDNSLFDACFRIQREACEASGRYIPLVVENVRGAQKWVGRSRFHFGSFHLWGDVPALMPMTRGRKNTGGSWFNVAHNTTSGLAQNPVNDYKVPRTDVGKGARFTSRDCGQEAEGFKGVGIGSVSWGQGKDNRHPNDPRNTWSKSPARKAASAMIAKIPLVLSRHIAASWYPHVGAGFPVYRSTDQDVRA